jgi:hypothetical protein
VLLICALWLALNQPVFAEDQTVVMIGEGAGEGDIAIQDAKNDARRKACEQAIGTLIANKTEVENFAVRLDMIVTKAQGIVKEEKILEGPTYDPATDITTIKMKITVGESNLKTQWAEVQMTLKRMGRPKIMIIIKDKVDDKVLEQTWTESTISNYFLEQEFELVDKEAFDEKMKREVATAGLKGDMNMLAALGKKAGAQLVIRGICTATSQGKMYHPNLGKTFYQSRGELTVKAIETNSARIIYQKPFTGTRTSQTAPESAGKQALEDVAKKTQAQLVDGILKAWNNDLNNGRMITLIVKPISFMQKSALQKLLKKLPRVLEVHLEEYSSKVATFRVRTFRDPNNLTERLVQLKAKKIDLTEENVEDVSVESSQVEITLKS